ncbi:MAG: endo-1,4-beta-xylanase [Planctomycetaceae bacterium]|jgi:hypothetical protein|nr:endo-1,4-beta-xylanase [Planctomycetaceae bacterium]
MSTTLRFRYPRDLLSQPLLHRAFFASWGRIPVPTQVRVEEDILIIESQTLGSGTVHFPWPNRRLGLVFLATETLCERERPYHIVKELARGQLGRTIRRFVELVYCGFKPNDKLRRTIRLEVARFANIATADDQSPELDEQAKESLSRLIQLSLVLNEMFLEQSLSYRKQYTPLFPIQLGVGVTSFLQENAMGYLESYADHLRNVFHLMNATPTWRELEPESDAFSWELFDNRIEAMRQNGFHAIGGPIVQFDFRSIPNWVLEQINNGDFFERAALKYVDTFLEHFSDKIDVWILTSKMNSHQLEQCPIQRLIHLTSQIVHIFSNHDPKSPGLIGIDQPWGDYLLHHETPFSPFNIAEILNDIPGIGGIVLDVNIGLSSRCSYPRDPMAFSAMIDQWSIFGKPLYLSFGVPSELGTNPDLPDEFVGVSFDWSRKTQQEWIHRCIPILFSKRSIAGVFWNQLEDSEYSEFGSFGLFDTVGRLKPAYRKLAAYRSAYLE